MKKRKPIASRKPVRSIRLEALESRVCLDASLGWEAAATAPAPADSGPPPASVIRTAFQNLANRFDVNGDGHVTPADALRIFNRLNTRGPHSLAGEGEDASRVGFVDCNGDGQLTPMDGLSVVNRLNQVPAAEAPSTSETTSGDSQNPAANSPPLDSSADSQTGDQESESADSSDPAAGAPAEGLETREQRDQPDPAHRRRLPLLGLDANEDGSLTVDEVPERLWDRLLAADTNQDGSLSLAELRALLPEQVRERIDLFARLDANDDGLLSQDEVPEELWKLIEPADTDDVSGISREELAAFPLVRVPGRASLFDRLDANDDGLLSADEVPSALWNVLEAADGDDDGLVSAEEFAAFRPRTLFGRLDLFARFDDDEDGLLTADEVPEGVWNYLQTADANEDGGVSREELVSFRPRRLLDRIDLFGRLDGNDDGLLTEGEIPPALWTLLQAADTNEDGGISEEELQAFRPSPPTNVWQAAFDRFDTDDDGLLTADELPEAIWSRLERADTNGDGGISLDELRNLIPQLPERPDRPDRPDRPQEPPTLFERLDANDDGLLTEDEVPGLVWRVLSRADADGDGSISAEEWSELRPGLPGDVPSTVENVQSRLDLGRRILGGRGEN